MGFSSVKTTVISEGSVPATDSARTSRVKPRFVRFGRRERIWNVRLHARENHLSYALSKHTPGDPSHESNNQSMGYQRKYNRKSDQLAAPKCHKRLLAEGGGRSCGRLEETEHDTELKR